MWNAAPLRRKRKDNGFCSVSGKLLWGEQPVANKRVVLKVNGTVLGDRVTWSDGTYNGSLYLPAVDNQLTTYEVEFIFEGDEGVTVNGMGILPNGTAYAVCTTLQYFGYEPTANCTLATVVPQAAYATASTKTPEQMQQEAQDSGCLRVWHEFSWWFPWYRVHFVSVCDEIDLYDQGISPLPLVGTTLTCSDTFLNIVRDLSNYAVWPVAATVAGAEFFALSASNGGPIGFLAAVIASTGIKILSYINNFNSINGLAGAFIGCIFSTVIGMLKWTWSFVADVIRVVMGVMKLAEFGFGNIYRIFSFCASLAYGTAILARLRDLGAVHI